jgi:predicted dehydrogenase
VPAAASLDELYDLTRAVEKSGLIYMTGETSYYYPTTLCCRKKWKEGAFGRFVYGEGEYYHDMSHGFYEAYQHSGGDQWKRVAGFPPMLYATHSTSMILSVTGARVTNVSCLGVKDHHEDGIFRKGANDWDNEFSNQSALMGLSDGGVLRVNEFRRVGGPHGRSVRLSFFGTEGVFEEQLNTAVFTDRSGKVVEDLSDAMYCRPKFEDVNGEIPESMRRELHQGMNGYTRFHDTSRLPESFTRLHNGHCGSHQFLVDDFLKGLDGAPVAHLDVRAAARFCAPGLVAHQSAMRGGERLEVPAF